LAFSIGIYGKLVMNYPKRLFFFPIALFLFLIYLSIIKFDFTPLAIQLNESVLIRGRDTALYLLYLLLLLQFVFLFIQYWRTCSKKEETSANSLEIIKWPSRISKTEHIRYRYHYERNDYYGILPPSNALMNNYGRLQLERNKVEQTGVIDSKNLAQSFTIYINKNYPSIHCVKDGYLDSFYRIINGDSVASLAEKSDTELQQSTDAIIDRLKNYLSAVAEIIRSKRK